MWLGTVPRALDARFCLDHPTCATREGIATSPRVTARATQYRDASQRAVLGSSIFHLASANGRTRAALTVTDRVAPAAARLCH